MQVSSYPTHLRWSQSVSYTHLDVYKRQVKDSQMAEESYQVTVADESRMTVTAGDDLGFVYGLLSISER